MIELFGTEPFATTATGPIRTSVIRFFALTIFVNSVQLRTLRTRRNRIELWVLIAKTADVKADGPTVPKDGILNEILPISTSLTD
jgi:hypothetical protein